MPKIKKHNKSLKVIKKHQRRMNDCKIGFKFNKIFVSIF